MAQKDKGRRRTTGPAPATNLQSLDSFGTEHSAPAPNRRDPFASWIARRVPVSLAAARVYAELHGIGGAHA